MRVTYDGPLDGVEIAVPGHSGTITVLHGESVEVPADYGERLLDQDIWKKAPEPKKPAKADTPTSEED